MVHAMSCLLCFVMDKFYPYPTGSHHSDSFGQKFSDSNALAMELLQSCIKPWTCSVAIKSMQWDILNVCPFYHLLPIVLYSTLCCGSCSVWLRSYVSWGNHLHQDLLGLAASWHQSKEGIIKCTADQANIYIMQLWRALHYNLIQFPTSSVDTHTWRQVFLWF